MDIKAVSVALPYLSKVSNTPSTGPSTVEGLSLDFASTANDTTYIKRYGEPPPQASLDYKRMLDTY